MPTWNHKKEADELTMINHAFIKELWDGAKGQALRDSLFAAKDLDRLRGLLNDPRHQLGIPLGMQIMLVDIEGARTKNFPEEIDQAQPWYALVLPPVPTKKSANPDYKAHQTSVEALFHASNDGYGM